MRFIAVYLVLSFTALAGCRPVVEPFVGCTIDDECAAGEVCTERTCTPSGGVDCEPDGLGNDDIDSALVNADAQELITGRMCPGTNEFFALNAAQNQPLHIYLEWEGGADLDAVIIPGSGAEVPFVNVVDDRYELGSAVLRAAPPFVVELRSDNLPATGAPYELAFKTGDGCLSDIECAGTCLPAPFTPRAPAGEDIGGDEIFSPGACVAPRPAACATPDALEGANDTRIAARPLAAGNKSSCHRDEDWHRVSVVENSSMSLTFRHTGPGAGDYLVELFDEDGNRVRSIGYRDLAANTDQVITVSFVDVGEYFVRVVQLHDEVTTYTLNLVLAPQSCSVANECALDAIFDYGRSECVAGACTCPAAGCAP